MKTRAAALLALAILLAVPPAPPAGARQVIKLGTVAPQGSPWYDALLEIADAWQKLSSGRVTLRIYPGGVAGDEPDMIRKMRIGQLQAAALSSSGLETLVPDVGALTFPLLVRTDGELERLLEKLGPRLAYSLEKKGFEVLTWSSAGWVYFFSRSPVRLPEDLMKQKLFFWGSDTDYVELLKNSGFHPVPLAVTDLLPSLQTGLVEAFGAPAAAALSFQWFSLAPKMSDLKWQPLPGASVITVKAWKEIPEDLRPLLKKAAADAGSRLQRRIRELNDQAVEVMKQHGLAVTHVPPEAAARWRELVREKATPLFIDRRFSSEIFGAVQEVLREYRRDHPDEGPPAGSGARP